MPSSPSLLSSLGLAARAGALVCGGHPVENALKKGRVHLVAYCADAGQATVRKYTRLAEQRQLPTVALPANAGRAAGKPDCVIFAVTDPNLAILVKNSASAPADGSS